MKGLHNMNKEWEIQARKEGATYFDENYDALKNKDKFKHEKYLNTSFWWFRKYKKQLLIFTDMIASEDYLSDVLTKETIATVYYYEVAPYLQFDRILSFYKNTSVEFRRIDFVPSQIKVFKTRLGKEIQYSTIVLAGENTIIFDKKYLGLKKDKNGDRQVYRIKDTKIHDEILGRFLALITK